MRAIVLPTDIPPSEASLKRQVLFFDSVLVPTAADKAILNANDVAEDFPDSRQTIRWGEIAPYPRATSYDDQFRYLRGQAEPAVQTGQLQFVSLGARSNVEATQNWVAALTALKSEALVRAALPDFQYGAPLVPMSSQAGSNLVIIGTKTRASAYMWMTQLDSSPAIPLEEEWRRVALGRLGRTLKAIRRATSLHAVPLAIDPTNRAICLALGAQAYGELPTPQDLAAAAVAVDAVDPIALDAALLDLRWKEVMRIRKEVFPAVSKLRGLIAASVRAAGQPQNSTLEPYLAELKKLKDAYRQAADDAAAAWRRIKIRTAEVTASSAAAGLTTVAPNQTYASVFTSIAAMIVVKATSGAIGDISAMVRASQKQKASPFFAFDVITKAGNAELDRLKSGQS